MNKNQAAAAVRSCADSLIEQLTRFDQGWDKGIYRDCDTHPVLTIKQSMEMDVAEAFHLSKQFSQQELVA